MAKFYIPQIKPGTAPGSIRERPEAEPSQVKIFLYNPQTITEYSVDDLVSKKVPENQDGVLWVQVVGLKNVELIKQLGGYFNLHPLALEDTVNTYQRSKVDNFQNYQFIVTRLASLKNNEVQRQQLSIFLGTHFIVTFLEHAAPFTEHFSASLQNAQSRVRQKSVDYLVYELLDYVTDCFFPIISYYSDRLDTLEHEVLESVDSNTVRNIQFLKKQLRTLKGLTWSHRDMVNALMRNELNLIHPETFAYFRDCYDHTIQQIDILESQRDSTNSLVDIYMSSIANRLNHIMKVLTVITVAFMPPCLLAAIWGMNFVNMPELHWQYGYLVAWGVMLFTSAGSLFAFWKKGWLRRD